MKLFQIAVISSLSSMLSLAAIAASVPSESSLVKREQEICSNYACAFDNQCRLLGNPYFCDQDRGRCCAWLDLKAAPDHAGWPVGLGRLIEVVEIPAMGLVRELNGMGGRISNLSKICVVCEPNAELKKRPELGVQVEYTVRLAFETRRSFNTNTQKIIDTTFPITTTSDGRILSDLNRPETSIAGVSGKASKIIMEFINPSGARTGKLLPSGSRFLSPSTAPRDTTPILSMLRIRPCSSTHPR
ncbi:hypothetical protein JOM56_002758 [Amanita muscaria]